MTVRLPADWVECQACGSETGPDRRARWESGDHDLDRWEHCEMCGAPLCDSCALSGIHTCEDE
jgi:hypothetical protein